MPSPLPEVIAYTDGACVPNPGPGGWAVVLLRPGRPATELAGPLTDTTNNRAELHAVVEALDTLAEPCRVLVRTDSEYVVGGVRRELAHQSNDLFGGVTPVTHVNADLWERFLTVARPHEVRAEWVRGHADDEWNLRADELARSRVPGTLPLDDADAVHVFTAAIEPSRGRGGWSALLKYRSHDKLLTGPADDDDATRLSLRAAVAGLRAIKDRGKPVHVYSMTDDLPGGASRLPVWRAGGWRTAGGEVPHRDLWEGLTEAGAGLSVRYHVARDPLPAEMGRAIAAARSAGAG